MLQLDIVLKFRVHM